MASTVTVPTPQIQLEDPLAHLPCSTIVEYGKGQMIYNQDQPSTNLYLVMDGRVKISRTTEDGRQVMIDIYQRDEFFGESSLLNVPHCAEQATALEGTKVMMWTASAIDEIVKRRPRLAVALMQILVQRTINFAERLESFSTDSIQRRLARSLLRFSQRFGRPEEDGSVVMVALTHDLLAQYVGTSREIITHYMARFRREGYMQYSRKEIVLRPQVLREWLRQNA